jgi:hypothetical protein
VVRYRTDDSGGFVYNGGPVYQKPRAGHWRSALSDKPIAAGAKIMELREDYQRLMEKQLNEWKTQIEGFKTGAEKIKVQSKVQYEQQLEKLRAAQADAWDNFNKLKSANDSTWTEFKAHMEKAGGEVKAAFESMTNFKH